MESFLKWAGGKRWLVPRLKACVPSFKTYYEPFLGSGCLFFALEPKQAHLSDSNRNLINCYRAIRNDFRGVIKVLKRIKVDKKSYYKIREKFAIEKDRTKKSAYFIYLNKTCWNGLYRVNLNGQFNVPVGNIERVRQIFDGDQLAATSRLLKRATLMCSDFEVAIRDAKRNDLVYFDPPYITSHMQNGFVKYSSKLFSQVDELRLSNFAEKLRRKTVSVVVSNADHPLIRQQYDGGFFKTSIQRASCIAADPTKRSRFSELLVTSFSLKPALK